MDADYPRTGVNIAGRFTYAYEKGDDDDLLAISAKLAETPCSPLYKGPVSPDKALDKLVKAASQI